MGIFSLWVRKEIRFSSLLLCTRMAVWIVLWFCIFKQATPVFAVVSKRLAPDWVWRKVEKKAGGHTQRPEVSPVASLENCPLGNQPVLPSVNLVWEARGSLVSAECIASVLLVVAHAWPRGHSVQPWLRVPAHLPPKCAFRNRSTINYRQWAVILSLRHFLSLYFDLFLKILKDNLDP